MGDGSKEEIQETLAVGVGTLAGSTIMLLTIPWGVGVYLNQRQLDHRTGKAKKVLVTSADGKSSYKPAVLDNGVRVMVPPFINMDEMIVVHTELMEYSERA